MSQKGLETKGLRQLCSHLREETQETRVGSGNGGGLGSRSRFSFSFFFFSKPVPFFLIFLSTPFGSRWRCCISLTTNAGLKDQDLRENAGSLGKPRGNERLLVDSEGVHGQFRVRFCTDHGCLAL